MRPPRTSLVALEWWISAERGCCRVCGTTTAISAISCPIPKNLLEDEPLWRASARAGRNAMDALRAGFTTLRGTGDRDYLDVSWKKAIRFGDLRGAPHHSLRQPHFECARR